MLLTLDTVTGGSAEPLYRPFGYVSLGVIPRYARGPLTPDLEATKIMYKDLAHPSIVEPKVMGSSPIGRTNGSTI
jgi:hypothetical protein